MCSGKSEWAQLTARMLFGACRYRLSLHCIAIAVTIVVEKMRGVGEGEGRH